MFRLAVPLLAALALAVSAASAQAQPRDHAAPQALYYSSYGHPQPIVSPASTAAAKASDDGPSWTAAVLGGVAVMLACGCAGVFAGRASVRPRATA
jgi:hypothetical protein